MSEALIFASTNPQYDDRLFIVHENCKLRIPAEHAVYTNCCFCFVLAFRTILVQNMFCRCCELLYESNIKSLGSFGQCSFKLGDSHYYPIEFMQTTQSQQRSHAVEMNWSVSTCLINLPRPVMGFPISGSFVTPVTNIL